MELTEERKIMNKHVRFLPIVLVILGGAVLSLADSPSDGTWETSYPTAIRRALETGKPILINFTGSDWCIWCTRLRKQVFNRGQFKKWAADSVILLELDFPRQKFQSKELRSQNRALKKKYGVRGFPTVLILTHQGKVLGRSGYRKGGPKPWIANAGQIIKGNVQATTFKVTKNLAAGMKAAKRQGRALLVIVQSNASDVKAFQKGLAKNPHFIRIASSCMIVATIRHSALDGKPFESAALVKLQKELSIDTNSRFILIDAKKRRLLHESPLVKSEIVLIKRLVKALPDSVLFSGAVGGKKVSKPTSARDQKKHSHPRTQPAS